MVTGKSIVIDPVTRLEGHGKIVIDLADDGSVANARFCVTEFRGFEKFCEGRMIWDMPMLTNRICGFCPVSHHLTSVKACEALLGVEIPPAAKKLRELLHMGQIIHSHALHFFFCAMPDSLFSREEPVENRNLFGMMKSSPNLVANAIRLRKAGQQIVDIVGGGRLHPVCCIPGGMSRPLAYLDRVEMAKNIINAVKIAKLGMKMIKDLYARSQSTFETFASFPSAYMGMVRDDQLELYDGPIRVIDQTGKPLAEFEAKDYLNHIAEKVEPTSWTKFTYFTGNHNGEETYRVAPLARLNIAKSIATPIADAELAEFKKIGNGKPLQGGLFYHYARMIELVYAVERARELINDPEILSHDVRVPVKRRGGEGVGALEAPRGTLFHHYWADENGKILKVNLVVATEHNNEAMNHSVRIVAEKIVSRGHIDERELNKLEMAIRCYDPCLSCSTHAHGKMPLEILVLDASGTVVNRYTYGDLD